MNYLKEITGKKDTSEFDVVSFPLVQKKKYFGTLEKTRQMCRLFISQGGAFWGAHWWCIFRCPVTIKRGRTSSSHLRKQMPFALHVAANEYRIARRCPPASLPANRQFFRMIAIPRLRRSAGLLSIFSLESFRNFLSSFSIFSA